MKRPFLLSLAGILIVTTSFACARAPKQPDYADSPQSSDGRFHNAVTTPKLSFAETAKLWWVFLFNKPAGTVPVQPIPVEALTRAQLEAAPDRSLFRLGHSTILMKLDGRFWLTDPVFSRRASPVQWMGPARFHESPIGIDELPPIEGVILSHNHYDHLDRASVLQLAGKTRHFLAPLGVGDQLIAWGVDAQKVQQFDWWQSTQLGRVRFVATPAQHFSGRSLSDANRTLWASWVILDDDLRVFFSGDTGYFDGFKQIGERYGPFDVTLLETGAYNERWALIHMLPEETVQAHLDLRGQWLFPVHNGTFDLGLHPWQEPFERISVLAAEKGVQLTTPRMGERLDLSAPHAGDAWWVGLR